MSDSDARGWIMVAGIVGILAAPLFIWSAFSTFSHNVAKMCIADSQETDTKWERGTAIKIYTPEGIRYYIKFGDLDKTEPIEVKILEKGRRQ